MVLRFKKCVLKIDEIHKDEISLEDFLDHEKEVIKLIQWWKSNDTTLQFKTSGSTGVPKKIDIDRWKIEYSAEATMKKLDPDSGFKHAVLCINPSMIGGAMVVFRALSRGLDLTILPPSSNPAIELAGDHKFDLVSLVPMQMKATDEEFWNRFDTILVGGADFQVNRLETSAHVYTTFGMTETVSHFALKEAAHDDYECIGDIEIKKREDNRLQIKGTLTENKWLLTSDVIECISSKQFKWKGRVDFIINSGGIKVNPESIETHLQQQLKTNFIISSLPDHTLGSKLILIVEGDPRELLLDFSELPKYESPKETHFLPEFSRTASTKIDRIQTQKLLNKQLAS